MNHINWVQQDPDYQTEYHVLKWETSHFHEPLARRTVNSALHKEGAAFAMPAGAVTATDAEVGLGQGPSVKSGGFALGHGQHGMALQESAGAQKGQDSVIISAQGAERQSVGVTSTQGAERQSVGVALTTAAVDHVGHSGIVDAVAVAIGQGSVRNRLKESAAHLQEMYQKQKEKIEKSLCRTRKTEKKPELPRKGTRAANREEILSMQAQNHYLLDSYDSSGQYRMLGK